MNKLIRIEWVSAIRLPTKPMDMTSYPWAKMSIFPRKKFISCFWWRHFRFLLIRRLTHFCCWLLIGCPWCPVKLCDKNPYHPHSDPSISFFNMDACRLDFCRFGGPDHCKYSFYWFIIGLLWRHTEDAGGEGNGETGPSPPSRLVGDFPYMPPTFRA